MNKKEQRRAAIDRVRAMTTDSKKRASAAIAKNLSTIASIESASTIMAYLPLQQEVDLRPLIELWISADKTVCIPIVNWDDCSMKAGRITSITKDELVETRYGLLEPKQMNPVQVDSIDIVVVPGIAFDKSGSRLGRGGGFYDRFLLNARPPISIGVAFEEQIINRVDLEPHDQLLTLIATPSRLLT
ncbi:5-formyltetrahydrofolate cyclo-ligase [PVC group bacterium]|nr:5-formyltetrahydrofolate cyclo-ligase [PVC group bacterium]